MEVINEFFNIALQESGVVKALFRILSFLAVALSTIHYMRTYFKTMSLGEPIKVNDVFKPLFITVVMLLWPYLYQLLDGTFLALRMSFQESLAAHLEDKYNASMDQLLKKLEEGPEVSLLSMNVNSICIEVMKYLLQYANFIVDAIVTIYVGINDLVLAMFVPLAIVLTLFKETSGAFIVWLKLFFKFRLFMIVDMAITHLCTMLLFFLMEKIPAYMGISLLFSPGVFVLILSLYLVAKIIFVLVSFNLLGKILESQDLGVGGATGGMAQGVRQAATMVVTKGTY
jgi:hypothetical protein